MIWIGAANRDLVAAMAGAPARGAARIDSLRWSRVLRRRTPVASEPTREIIQSARAGDPDAFGTVFREHGDEVLRVCQRMLGGPEAAADAQSEVFLKARRSLDSYDDERSFRSWLLAIASNHCVDQLRRVATERKVFADVEADPGELPAVAPSSLSRLITLERQHALDAAIEALPIKYRLPLLLRYFSESSYDEIAEQLGTTRAQVGTLLFRAKRRLREQMAGGDAATSADGARDTKEESHPIDRGSAR